MQMTRNSSCLHVTFGLRHGENADIFDTLYPKVTMGKDPKNDLFHSALNGEFLIGNEDSPSTFLAFSQHFYDP